MGRHGDRTKAAVSAWLSEDFSVGTYTRHQIEEQVLHYAKMRNTDDGIAFSGGLRSLAPIIRSLIGERLEKSVDVWIIKPVRVPRGSLGKDEAKMVLKRHLTVMDLRTAASKDAQIERLEAKNGQLLAQLEKEQRERAALEAALMEPSLWGGVARDQEKRRRHGRRLGAALVGCSPSARRLLGSRISGLQSRLSNRKTPFGHSQHQKPWTQPKLAPLQTYRAEWTGSRALKQWRSRRLMPSKREQRREAQAAGCFQSQMAHLWTARPQQTHLDCPLA